MYHFLEMLRNLDWASGTEVVYDIEGVRCWIQSRGRLEAWRVLVSDLPASSSGRGSWMDVRWPCAEGADRVLASPEQVSGSLYRIQHIAQAYAGLQRWPQTEHLQRRLKKGRATPRNSQDANTSRRLYLSYRVSAEPHFGQRG